MAEIELKSVRDLLKERFFVPDYQRGYRWGQQQVVDLLEDISEFIVSDEFSDAFYCLQPLVVRETVDKVDAFLERLPKNVSADALSQVRKALSEFVEWEVIDGQQRLTTIHVILSYLGFQPRYALRYARTGKVLNEAADKACESVDSWYIRKAFDAVSDYFDGKTEKEINLFLYTLVCKVRFIWYEKEKSAFLSDYVVPTISEILKRDGCNNLDETYEVDGKDKKTKCRSLLLLHNLQTVIDQNKHKLEQFGVYSRKEND